MTKNNQENYQYSQYQDQQKQENQDQQNQNQENKVNSIVLNLESLTTEYDTVLLQYNQVQTDYVNYLGTQSTACNSYNSNSTNINQECYNDIWAKSGCTTTGFVNANTSWAQSQTLYGLIKDSWYWATLTDSQHRQGCYGNNASNIIPIGTTMSGPWIGTPIQVQAIKPLNGGNVYMIEQGIYTKMVLESDAQAWDQTSGTARYYTGHINDFSADKWDTYNDAGSNYILNLSPNYNILKQPLSYIKGQAFLGSGSLNTTQNISNVNDCKALCSSTNSCTGATFNNSNNTCSLRTGEGDTIPSSTNSYAIIPENIRYLNILNKLNKKLTDINQKIIQSINQNQPFYNNINKIENNKTEILKQNYEKLNREQIKIHKLLKDSQDLDEAQTQGTILINRNYYFFVFLLIIIIISIIILIKLSSSSKSASTQSSSITSFANEVEQNSNPYYKIFGLILFCLVIYYFMKFNSYMSIRDFTDSSTSSTSTSSGNFFNKIFNSNYGF